MDVNVNMSFNPASAHAESRAWFRAALMHG
jgi:hypothetical protein